LNLIELALAKKIMQEPDEKIKNTLKVFHAIHKYKQLNEIELFEFTRIELKEIYQLLELLQEKKIIIKNNGKYYIPEILKATEQLIEIKEEKLITIA
jgi:transcription initiation factor IIE alpha subunit